MIKYTLKCEQGHQFDSWFQSASAFDRLVDQGFVTCSVCGAVDVEKAIMAPQVQAARNAANPPQSKPQSTAVDRPLSAPASPAEQALVEMRKVIEAKAENVGTDFAAEARAIHDGDAPERMIIGEAKPAEAKALLEDGVPITPLPWGKTKTN